MLLYLTDTFSKVPLRVGYLDPHINKVLWAHPSLHPKRHLDRFSVFAQLIR